MEGGCLKNHRLPQIIKRITENWCGKPAFITPGLRLAFQDSHKISLEGRTLLGENTCRDFSEPDGVGPSRVAQFLYAGPDADLQADVVGFVQELLSRCNVVRGVNR